MPRKREKTAAPVRPRVADSRTYERELARIVVNPMLARAQARVLAGGESLAGAMQALAGLRADPALATMAPEAAERHIRRLERWHRARMLSSLRTSFGLDLRPLSSELGVAAEMRTAIADNVSLIRTIPERFHARLRKAMEKEFREAPFDRARLSGVLQTQFGSEGKNLKRLTRDQTTKAIGKFTGARHRQVGITEYIWQTSGDERVRESHALLDGTRQSWAAPPDPGHPGEDILCRCVAVPIIPKQG